MDADYQTSGKGAREGLPLLNGLRELTQVSSDFLLAGPLISFRSGDGCFMGEDHLSNCQTKSLSEKSFTKCLMGFGMFFGLDQ
jgi:hypothetical protein